MGLCGLGLNSINMARKLLPRTLVALVSLQDVLHDFGHAGKLRCIDRLRLRLIGQEWGISWAGSLDTGLQTQQCTLAFDRRTASCILLECFRLVRSCSYLPGRLLRAYDLSQLLTMSKYLTEKLGAPPH